ncbi:MAG TPA: hypothetical protein VHO07_13925 [Streptosporangiaceae bacterium]|jgi:hypothetical protein|nr:hypothetical protein [Streptosporangiaceae bacterium]
MSDDRACDRDRLTVARLTGAAQRHASWREPTQEETAAAVAELREIAGPRTDLLAPDLLAEVAGLLTGFYAGTAEEPRARTAAGYCRAAGADQDLIPRWIAEGKRRAACARQHSYPSSLAS